MTKICNLTSEPRGRTYAELLSFAKGKGYRALLVTRLPEWIDAEGRNIVQRMSPWLVAEREAQEWPGTILHGNESAMVRTYSLTDECADALIHNVEGLWGWQHPSRPEDLCLLRETGEPFLVTIAHEQDGYFDLDEDERKELEASVPGIGQILAWASEE